MEHPKFDKVFNEEALGNYLSFQFVPTNETFFKGVFCLQPVSYTHLLSHLLEGWRMRA